MSSNYNAHIRIQYNESGIYVENEDIIFSPSWDTEEKRESAVIKIHKKENVEEK